MNRDAWDDILGDEAETGLSWTKTYVGGDKVRKYASTEAETGPSWTKTYVGDGKVRKYASIKAGLRAVSQQPGGRRTAVATPRELMNMCRAPGITGEQRMARCQLSQG